MSEFDFANSEMSEGEIHIYMVSQNDKSSVYGELEGVDLSGSSLTAAYYTDTRTSGRLSVHNTNWIRNSFLRVDYIVPKFGYSRVLGTYVVTDDNSSFEKNSWKTDLTLQSAGLYTLSNDLGHSNWTVAKGASAKKALKQMLDASKQLYIDKSSNDYTMGDNVVYEAGGSVLERIFALAEMAQIRLDVDPYGKITLNNYIHPFYRAPSYRFDLTDVRGVIQDGISRSSDWMEIPGKAIVRHKWSEEVGSGDKKETVEREVIGYAEASGNFSPGARGYYISNMYDVDDMSPKTVAEATRLAQNYIKADANETVEWSINMMYAPIWEGDIVDIFIPPTVDTVNTSYTGIRRCLVKDVDINLQDMTMSVSLKETSNIYSEEDMYG